MNNTQSPAKYWKLVRFNGAGMQGQSSVLLRSMDAMPKEQFAAMVEARLSVQPDSKGIYTFGSFTYKIAIDK